MPPPFYSIGSAFQTHASAVAPFFPIQSDSNTLVKIITHECLEGDSIRCVINAVPAGTKLGAEDYVRIGDLAPVFDWPNPFPSFPPSGFPVFPTPTSGCSGEGECSTTVTLPAITMTPTPTTPDEATETSDPSESIDSNSTDDFDGGDDDNTPTPTTHIIATITPEPPTPPEFDPNFNPGPDSECTTLCDRPTQAPTSSLSDDPDTTYKTAISVLPHPEPPVAPPPPPEAYSTYHDPRHVAARTAAPLTLATTVIPKPTARVVGKAQLGHLTEGYEWTHSSAETFATPTAFALPSKPTRKVDRVMNKGVFGKEELMKAIGLGSLMGKNEDEDEDRKHLSSRRSSHRYGQLEPISLVLDRIKYFISKGYIIPGNFKLALLDDIKHLIDFNSTATVYPEITKKPEEDKQLIFKEQRALEAAGTFFEMHTIALLSDLLDHPERLNKTQQQILDAIAIFEAYTKYVYANVGDYGLFINKGDSTARKEAYGGPYLPAITAKEAGQTVAAVIMAVVGMVILIGMATYAVKLLQERRRA